MIDLLILPNAASGGFLVGIILSVAVFLVSLRIPFKRAYNWIFLIFVGSWTIRFIVGFVAQSSPTPEIFFERVWWTWFTGFPFNPMIYHFVVLFTTSKMAGWQKISIVGGYLWSLVIFQGFALINPTWLFQEPVRITSTGFASSQGLLAPYLWPLGIAPVDTFLYVLAGGMLLNYYRSNLSPLRKSQTRYVAVGVLIFLAGLYAWSWLRYISGPQALPFLQTLGMAAFLVGLTRSRFLSITPTAEQESKTTERLDLKPATSYLYLGSNSDYGFEAFAELVKHNRFGLCLTRSSPDIIQETFKLGNTPIIWMSEESGGDNFSPTDLRGIHSIIKDFLRRASPPVVLLEGLGYLISVNGFSPVLRLIIRLSDLCVRHKGIFILPATQGELTDREYGLLISQCPSMVPLETPAMAEEVKEKEKEDLGGRISLEAGSPSLKPRAMQFKRRDAEKAFGSLAKAFLHDYGVLRMTIESAGWRTAPEVAKSAKLSRYRIYGQGGFSGSALAELLKRGLAETRWVPGQPGRGGKIMKIRVNQGNPYVKEELDGMARQA